MQATYVSSYAFALTMEQRLLFMALYSGSTPAPCIVCIPSSQPFWADLAAWTSMAAPRSSALLLGLRRLVFSPSLSLQCGNNTLCGNPAVQGADPGACRQGVDPGACRHV